MVKFAANLTFLFKEYPPHERIDKAALAGFEHVEILNPYELPATEIQRALARHQVGLTLINCPPPNYTGGAAGFAAQPEQQDRFRLHPARHHPGSLFLLVLAPGRRHAESAGVGDQR